MKYYDNVIKIFCVTASNFVVYFCDLFVFETQRVSPLYLLGFVLVAAGIVVYSAQTTTRA